jgi:hypothetical protein
MWEWPEAELVEWLLTKLELRSVRTEEIAVMTEDDRQCIEEETQTEEQEDGAVAQRERTVAVMGEQLEKALGEMARLRREAAAQRECTGQRREEETQLGQTPGQRTAMVTMEFEIPEPRRLFSWQTRAVTVEQGTAPAELDVGELSVVDMAEAAPVLVLEGSLHAVEVEQQELVNVESGWTAPTELRTGEREQFVFEIPAQKPWLRWGTRGFTFERWTVPAELDVGELSVVDVAAAAPALALEGEKVEFEVPHRSQEWIGQRECWRWATGAPKVKPVLYRKTRWVKGKAAPTGETWTDRSESRAIEVSGEIEVPEVNRDELVRRMELQAEMIQTDMARMKKESESRALGAQQAMDRQHREYEGRVRALSCELDQLRQESGVRAEDVARLRAQLAMARRGRTHYSSLRPSQAEVVEIHEREQRWWGW